MPGSGQADRGLAAWTVPCSSEKALRDLRRGWPGPLKALFEVVAGPLAQPCTPGVRFGGLRTVAFDGCNSLKVPTPSRNRWWLGRIRYRMGFAGYPTLRLMALAETGTRGLLGAALGSAADRDEATVARRLLPLLRPGMLILLDRAFDANAFLREVAATGALLLARAKSTRHPPVLGHLPDGSYLSDLDGLAVRVIEASVTVTGADGSRVRDGYRLITTLMDHRRFPAAAVVRLYHERWEIESAYFALRHTLLNGHVLRSGDRPGLEQETWALLTLYQLLRMAMVDAVETRPGTDPDRASFTTAMEAAKDQLTAAAGICPDGPADLPGAIGRAVLATLLPARRPRYSARKVKCATSRYLNRDDGRPAHPATITAIDIAISTPPVDLKPGRTRRERHTPPAPPARAADPPGADHRHHHQPAPARLERPRTRRPAGRQTPQHAHPARRMGTPGLLHPHRLRHLQTQHAASRYTLDKPARPLTSRLCGRGWKHVGAGGDSGQCAAVVGGDLDFLLLRNWRQVTASAKPQDFSGVISALKSTCRRNLSQERRHSRTIRLSRDGIVFSTPCY